MATGTVARDQLASCELQTQVYNDTPLDGSAQPTGQETQTHGCPCGRRARYVCILSENMSD